MIEIFLDSRRWLWALLLVNLAGFLFGIWYYLPQLSGTSPLLWLFVIDCPLYVFLFAGICALKLKGKTIPDWLYYLTSVGLIKYGLWTGLVVFLYWETFFSFSPVLYTILTPLHVGMILEGLVLIPRMGEIQEGARMRKLLQPLFVCGWFLLNDWLDYFLGTHPLVPPTHLGFLMWESFAATISLTILVFFFRGRYKRGRISG